MAAGCDMSTLSIDRAEGEVRCMKGEGGGMWGMYLKLPTKGWVPWSNDVDTKVEKKAEISRAHW